MLEVHPKKSVPSQEKPSFSQAKLLEWDWQAASALYRDMNSPVQERIDGQDLQTAMEELQKAFRREQCPQTKRRICKYSNFWREFEETCKSVPPSNHAICFIQHVHHAFMDVLTTCQSEISNFIQPLIKQDVGRLHITMDDIEALQILEAFTNLPEHVEYLGALHLFVFLLAVNKISQITSATILSDDIEEAIILYDITNTWKASSYSTMFGCLSCLRMLISFRISSSVMSCPSISLIATWRLVRLLRPRQTLPQEPCPMQQRCVKTQSPIWISISSSMSYKKIQKSSNCFKPQYPLFQRSANLSINLPNNQQKQLCWPVMAMQVGGLAIVKYYQSQQSLNQKMQALLSNLNRFVSTLLELYCPLPFELVADLHTLNAYLRNYTDSEEKLFEGFVNRTVEKLEKKITRQIQMEFENITITEPTHIVLNHSQSCAIKHNDLDLNIPKENGNGFNLTQGIKPREHPHPLSQREGRSKDKLDVRSDRHKFGSRQRARNLQQSDKENDSYQFNFKITRDQSYDNCDADRSLKSLRSEADSTNNNSSLNCIRKNSIDIQQKEQQLEQSKNASRNGSNESKMGSGAGSFKIKLRTKPTLDIHRLREEISSLASQMEGANGQLLCLFREVCGCEEVAQPQISLQY